MIRRTVRIAVPLVLALWMPHGAVQGEPLAWTSTWGAGGDPLLERLDLATGEATAIGHYGLSDATAGPLAFAPSGTLYAIDPAQQRLLELDPVTGEASVVGGFGISLPAIFGFTADAGGRLWVTGTPTGGLEPLGLYRVDPTTGQAELATLLSRRVSGLSACGDRLIGLVTGQEAQMVEIDPDTGAVTELLPLDGWTQIAVTSHDLAPNGDLWSFASVLIPIDPLPRMMFRIAPDGSGEVTYVGYFLHDGLAIAPPGGSCDLGTPLAVPAASPPALIALAVLLACAGVLALVRRRRYAS